MGGIISTYTKGPGGILSRGDFVRILPVKYTHLFLRFWHFRGNSANFLAKCLFAKASFRQSGILAKWFSAKCWQPKLSFYNAVLL